MKPSSSPSTSSLLGVRHLAVALLLCFLSSLPAAAGFQLCDADFGSSGGQNSSFDLGTRRVEVRADGGAATEHSSDAELGFHIQATADIEAAIEIGVTFEGLLIGSLGIDTIYGDLNITAFLRDITDGIVVEQQVLAELYQDGAVGEKIIEPVTSDPFGPPVAVFENVQLEAGHLYGVSIRAIAKAKGTVGVSDFKNGSRSIDVGCALVTPEHVDSDGDGLLDYWETDGLDVDFDGIADVDLPAFGAQWDHKDLFLELDWRTGQEPSRAEIFALKQAFALAPVDAGGVTNPDLIPGINLWVDTGGLMDGAFLVGDDLGGGNEIAAPVICLDDSFYAAKALSFDPARLPVFRYAVIGISPGENTCANGSTPGGLAELGGNDFISYSSDPAFLLHELGHNLNLRHGGFENRNNKPNYVSMMNYNYGLGIPQANGSLLLDLSPPLCPSCPGGRGAIPATLDERALDESQVLDTFDDGNVFFFRDLLANTTNWPMNGLDIDGDGFADVDWDGDGVISGGTVSVDINEDGKCVGPGTDGVVQSVAVDDDVLLPDGILHDGPDRQCDTAVDPATDDVQLDTPGDGQPDMLAGHDDWSAIVLPPLAFGDDELAALNLPEEPERSLAETLAAARESETTDLELVKRGPEVANVDEVFTYRLEVTNLGPRFARGVRVTDQLPAEAILVASPEECFAPGDERLVVCEPGPLFPGERHVLLLSVVVPSAAVAGLPAPVKIENKAHVENRVLLGFKGSFGVTDQDLDPSNNTDSAWTIINRPPVADAGLAYAVECQGARSDLQLDGSASADPDGDALLFQWTTTCPGGVFTDAGAESPLLRIESTPPFPVACSVQLEVTDPGGLAENAASGVTVADTTAPSLTVVVDPALLWPADHGLRVVEATVQATDACSAAPVITLASIFSDEPDDAPGPEDGATTGDISAATIGTADFGFRLRAERSDLGDGRIYSVVYSAVDEAGLMSSVVVPVEVPLNN